MNFSSCDNCQARCCDGKEGSVYAQIILSDFEKTYKYFPILFLFGELGYLKPVILLSDGKNHCPYIENYKCIIYENRPTICKVYPLSANLDNLVYFDNLCPAITDIGMPMVENNQINKNFHSEILDDYQDKYIKTHEMFAPFNKKEDFEEVTIINNEKFYKYIGKQKNHYLELHLKSLINLKNYNF